MVRKHDISLKDFTYGTFKTRADLNTFLERYTLSDTRRIKRKADFVKIIKKDLKDFKKRQLDEEKEKLKNDKKWSELEVSSLPNVKTLSKPNQKKFTKSLNEILNLNSNYLPRIIMFYNNNMFDKSKIKGIITSSEMAEIRKLLDKPQVYSNIITSEEDFKRSLGEIADIVHSAIKEMYFSRNDTEIRRIAKQVFTGLNYKIYTIAKTSVEGMLKYKINGRTQDFVKQTIEKCSEEAEIDENTYNDEPINCVIQCIISQIPKYLGKRRKKRLLETFNKKDITFEDMDLIAKTLEINITAIDPQGYTWHRFIYYDKPHNKTSREVFLIIYNNHARNVKKQIRTNLARYMPENCFDYTSVKHVITPINDEIKDYKVYDSKIKNDKLLIKVDKKWLKMENIKDLGDIICEVTYDLELLAKNLIKEGFSPDILSNHRGYIEISINMNSTTFHLRNANHYHEFTDSIPWKYNHTIGSSVMYLFRKYLQTGLLKITDPLIAKLFKNIGKPLIFMDKVNIKNKKVYLIDLNKAYKNSCEDLGTFASQPTFHMNPTFNQTVTHTAFPDGIYELYPSQEWVTLDEFKYRFKTNKKMKYRYFIPYSARTNVLKEFADYIYDEDSEFEDMPDNIKKASFNILVGKLNPNLNYISSNSVFKNKEDYERFLLAPNTQILNIEEIEDDVENTNYLVEYRRTIDNKHLIDKNASYLSSQIIARCKLKIKKQIDILKNDGYKIVGCMTDSILFYGDKEFNEIPEGFKLEAEGDELITGGVGQYHIKKDDEIIVDKHMGYSETIEEKVLREFVKHSTKIHEKPIKIPPRDTQCSVIIGPAGVGKSHFIKENYRNNYILMAYTGEAAYEINGHTINGYFCLGLDDKTIEQSFMRMGSGKRKELLNCKGIVIDEYYTLGASIAKKMDELLRIIRCDSRPFGGLDIILVGDDAQTEAIGDKFIETDLYKSLQIRDHRELEPHNKMRLHKDYYKFTYKMRLSENVLNKDEMLEILRDDRFSKVSHKGGISLYYTNSMVNKRNKKELKKFPGEEKDGFKPGCPIRVIKCPGLHHGVRGRYLSSDKSTIHLEVNNQIYSVAKSKVELELAFAMTIHKAQCKTMKKINIYIQYGQLERNDIQRLLYTALTRVRNFEDCYIKLI